MSFFIHWYPLTSLFLFIPYIQFIPLLFYWIHYIFYFPSFRRFCLGRFDTYTDQFISLFMKRTNIWMINSIFPYIFCSLISLNLNFSARLHSIFQYWIWIRSDSPEECNSICCIGQGSLQLSPIPFLRHKKSIEIKCGLNTGLLWLKLFKTRLTKIVM